MIETGADKSVLQHAGKDGDSAESWNDVKSPSAPGERLWGFTYEADINRFRGWAGSDRKWSKPYSGAV